MRQLLLSATLLVIALGGCIDRTSINSMSTTSTDSSYIMSDLQLYQTSFAGDPATYTKATAYLQNKDSASPVYGGTLQVNGVTIPDRHLGHGTTYIGTADSGTAPLLLDGSWQTFAITGSSAYPGFTDSLRSPIGATVITSPAHGSTVSRITGFTLAWNANTTGGVHIILSDTAIWNPGPLVDTLMNPDPGSVTFMASKLSTLSNGPLTVTVTRGNIKYGIAGQHARYRIGIGSSRQMMLNLAP